MPRHLPFLVCLLAWPWTVGAVAVRDDTGLPVALDAPARRVITLAPHATELVLALDAADRLVGMVPAGAAAPRLPGVARLSAHTAVDREAVLTLRPDLVIAWHSGNRPADLAWLGRQGFAVYRSEPATLGAIAADLRDIGTLLGRSDAGNAAAERYLADLRSACPAGAGTRRAYVALWDAPPLTVGGRHWINEVLARAGYANAFGSVPRAVLRIGAEARMLAGELPVIRATSGTAGTQGELVIDGLGRPGPGVVAVLRRLCRFRN